MTECDVAIVGAGPAGSAAAIQLAERGYSVIVIDRATFPRPHIGESLPPKIEPLLAILGVARTVARAGFARMRGTTISQGSGTASHDFHPSGERLGYQVDRSVFDRILVDRARAAGVKVLEGSIFYEATLEKGRVLGIVVAQGRDRAPIRSKFVVDASGSAAVVARSLGVKKRDAIRTVAMTAYWRECRTPDPFPATNTLFEMMPGAWLWSVLRGDGLRNVSVGVDPKDVKKAGVPNVELYLDLVRGSVLVGPLVDRAKLAGALEIHDASWSASETYAGDGFLLAGDAASCIDPLTSQGVYKAIQSGIMASAVIHTCLSRPSDRAMALAYHQAAQEEIQKSYAEIALTFYRASQFVEQPFWKARTRPEDLFAAHLLDERVVDVDERRQTLIDRVGRDGGDRVRVRRTRELRVDRRPVAEGGLIVLRPAFLGDLGFVDTGTVDTTALFASLEVDRTVADLFEDYVLRTKQPRSASLARILLFAVASLFGHQLVVTS